MLPDAALHQLLEPPDHGGVRARVVEHDDRPVLDVVQPPLRRDVTAKKGSTTYHLGAKTAKYADCTKVQKLMHRGKKYDVRCARKVGHFFGLPLSVRPALLMMELILDGETLARRNTCCRVLAPLIIAPQTDKWDLVIERANYKKYGEAGLKRTFRDSSLNCL